MGNYVDIPITVDPEQLIADVYTDMAERFPGWTANEGSVEVWLIRAIVYRLIVPLAELTVDVPGAIFAKFGEQIHNVARIAATGATGATTWTMVDNAGYTIPADTELLIRDADGILHGFKVQDDVAIPAGSTVTDTGEVVIVATEPGLDGNGLTNDPSLVDALAYVAEDGIALEGTTAGGVDEEDELAYLDRLHDTLETLSPTPILPRDVEILARSIPGVARASALDGYNADDETSGQEKTLTVAVVDADGEALSAPTRALVVALLESLREVNFLFFCIDPTYTTIKVNAEVVVFDGFDHATVAGAVADAITAFLSPGNWGKPPFGPGGDDQALWLPQGTVRHQDLSTVVNNVQGVDYWTTLELAAGADAFATADVALTPPAPLPRAGAITVEGAVEPGGGGGGGGGGDGLTLADITEGLTEFWSDDCSNPDPIAAEKYHGASLQTADNTGNAIEFPDDLSSPHPMETDPAPRFEQFSTGGSSGGGRYHFFAPQGDNIFSDGTRGRASIEYPKYDPGSEPAHIGPEDGENAGFFYEGRRAITSFSTRVRTGLSAPEQDWDLNLVYPPGDDEGLPVWRLLSQWKRNEWYTVTDPDDSPALSFEQKDNLYLIRNLGVTEYAWQVSALGTLDDWVRWAFDITFSQDPGTGKFRVYADFDNDGIYEYDSGDVTGIQTLSSGSDVDETGLPGPVAARFPAEGIEAFVSIGCYEGFGGDSDEFSDLAIHGTLGG